jgi:hypothetical protein
MFYETTALPLVSKVRCSVRQKTPLTHEIGGWKEKYTIDMTSYTCTHDVQSDLSYPRQGMNQTRKPHIEAWKDSSDCKCHLLLTVENWV